MSLTGSSTSKVLATQRLFLNTINLDCNSENLAISKKHVHDLNTSNIISDDDFRKIGK